MYNILICDDEPDIVNALKIYLADPDYRLLEASNGRQALAVAEREDLHLVLLDIMMPELDGIAALAALRKISNVPVILLTAKSEDADKILGLNVGADDYITKPFSFDTVLARVKAVLRRSTTSSESSLSRLSRESSLTRREHLILDLFQQQPGRFFTREEILKAVWPDDAFVGERSVDVHIARLRKKLGSEGQRIVNKTGFGYGLV